MNVDFRVETVVSAVLRLAALETFHSALYTSGKHRGCQPPREKTYKLSSVMKKTAPFYRGALVPARLFPIRTIFHIWVSERAGAAYTQACKVTRRRYKVECKLTFFCHMFDLASDAAMASRWGFKNAPLCFYKAIISELPTLYLSRKTSFIAPWGPSCSLNVSSPLW